MGLQGILFLTTNRVGSIDQAFKSRIHISLFYPRLTLKSTLQIWENSIRHVKKQDPVTGRQFKVRSKGILKFAKEHYKELKDPKAGTWPWNGR
jgi:hypothetical protein